MKFKITSAELNEVLNEETASLDFRPESGLKERSVEMEYGFGKAIFHEISFEGVHISFGDFFLNKPIRILVEGEEPCIGLHFELSGSSYTQAERFSEPVLFTSHQHNIIIAPCYKGEVELTSPKNKPYKIFEIQISFSFFNKLYQENSFALSIIMEHVRESKHGILSKNNLWITPSMLSVIYEIINCNRKGYIKKLYLEAKVIELFTLQLEQFENINNAPDQFSLQKNDLDKIHQAKDIIIENINEPCSLIHLAGKVGLNDFKLKKGFKEVYGTTIFDYLSETRMEKARLLLLEGKMNINEVSDAVGYKHSTHFTAAFKKKFGFLPKEIKRKE